MVLSQISSSSSALRYISIASNSAVLTGVVEFRSLWTSTCFNTPSLLEDASAGACCRYARPSGAGSRRFEAGKRQRCDALMARHYACQSEVAAGTPTEIPKFRKRIATMGRSQRKEPAAILHRVLRISKACLERQELLVVTWLLARMFEQPVPWPRNGVRQFVHN